MSPFGICGHSSSETPSIPLRTELQLCGLFASHRTAARESRLALALRHRLTDLGFVCHLSPPHSPASCLPHLKRSHSSESSVVESWPTEKPHAGRWDSPHSRSPTPSPHCCTCAIAQSSPVRELSIQSIQAADDDSSISSALGIDSLTARLTSFSLPTVRLFIRMACHFM